MDYKSLKGKTVYLLPTGNLVPSNQNAFDGVQEAVVTKKSSVNVYFGIPHGNATRSVKCRFLPHKPELVGIDGINGGYHVFLSRADINTYANAKVAKTMLLDNIHDLTDTELVSIAETLGWELP